MKISVVLPAYNESSRIVASVKKVNRFLARRYEDYEVIVVDDGSTDETARISEELGVKVVRNGVNRGKGFAVRCGVSAASFPTVLMTDCDAATPIRELDRMHKALDTGYDIVIGSRNMPGSNVGVYQPFYRRLAGQAFPLMVRLMLGLKYRDTQCGFKIFRTDLVRDIMTRQTIERFAFDVELLYIAEKMGAEVKELPVIWRSKGESKVRLLRDSGRMFLDLLKIRLNDIRNLYD